MHERRGNWIRHNRLEKVRPLILAFPEASWKEIFATAQFLCENEKAREIEAGLRFRLLQHEIINDDSPIEKTWKVFKKINSLNDGINWNLNWGLKIKRHESSKENGAYGFEPVLKNSKDLKLIRAPELFYDETATLDEYKLVQEIVGTTLM